jgi:cytosine/adenosine deaminase-related metal-dependent hydrolase
MGSGVTPVADLLAAGVNVSLGTDGGPANNGADLIRDFKWVGYLQKLAKADPTVVPREQIVEMATMGGAQAVGLDHLIGSVEVGKRADLIVLRTDAPHWTPMTNVLSNLVYAASGADVDTVIIDGRVVMEGRRMTTMDERAVIEEASGRAAALFARTGVSVPNAWPVV